MSDSPGFLLFDEGEDYLNVHGWPATVYFMLSTRFVTSGGAGSAPHNETDTLAGTGHGGEITGTGYARISQSVPSSSGGQMLFTAMTWSTSSHTDWPTNVCSIVATTTSDNTGVMLGAWDLNAGNARDMSQASTTEQVTPTYTL